MPGTNVLKPAATAPCLAVLGTGSDVGKSVVSAALCRWFTNRGYRVAPFKAQNMSNNSGVTPEGLEMGRAQIVQAEAARVPPHVDMNPVLLKPTSEIGSQVVVLGRVAADTSAKAYHRLKTRLFAEAAAALDRLRRTCDLVVMEGAGSCAEVNLMNRDIVNFPMAEHAQAPVILVADIHKGGVFAQIVGSLAVIPEKWRRLVSGFIINRFRGDSALFDDGSRWIAQETARPVFGVLPWFRHFSIPSEDSVAIENPVRVPPGQRRLPALGVIRLPHISNFTDFDPLLNVEGLHVYFLEQPQDLHDFAAVILPGSKNTRHDLQWINDSGWRGRIKAFARNGGHVLGICGGFQMMGTSVRDPQGTEGRPGETAGLDLLPVATELKAPKTTTLSSFSWNGLAGTGYEIHMGHTQRHGGGTLFRVSRRNNRPCSDEDGCIADNRRAMGTYMHGLFDTPAITCEWLQRLGLGHLDIPADEGFDARDHAYDQLAAHLEAHVDVAAIEQLIQQDSITGGWR